MNYHELSTWKLLEKLAKDFDVKPARTDFIKKSPSTISIENFIVSIKPSREFTNKSLTGSASYELSTVKICNNANNINSKSTESTQEISLNETNLNSLSSADGHLFQGNFVKKPESYSKEEKSVLGSIDCKSLTDKDGVSNKEKTKEISKKNISNSYTISKEDIACLKEKKNEDGCSSEEISTVSIDATTDVSKPCPSKSVGNVSKDILDKVKNLVTPFGSNEEILLCAKANQNKQNNFVSDKNLKKKLLSTPQKKPPLKTRRPILKASFRGRKYVIKPYYWPYRDQLSKYPVKNAFVETPLKSNDKKCGTDANELTYVPENLKFFRGWENTGNFPEDHPWFSWISDCENGFPKDVFKNAMVDKWTNTDEDLEENYRENNLFLKKVSFSPHIVSATIPVKINHKFIDRVPSVSNQKKNFDSTVS